MTKRLVKSVSFKRLISNLTFQRVVGEHVSEITFIVYFYNIFTARVCVPLTNSSVWAWMQRSIQTTSTTRPSLLTLLHNRLTPMQISGLVRVWIWRRERFEWQSIVTVIIFFSLSDIKAADEGGAGFESAEDQEENESFEEPKDEATCIVASEITKENNSLEKPLEHAKTVTEAKNDVTSWATWASKASAAPVDNSSSRSQAKRYLTVAYSVAFE